MVYVQLKDPDADDVDFTLDWTDYLEPAETIASTVWTIEPTGTGALAKVADSFGSGITTIRVKDGIRGEVYRASCAITTSASRKDERSITIRVGER